MDLLIVQTANCALLSVLKQLRDSLPQALLDRAGPPDLRPADVFPHEVVRLSDASEDDEALIAKALSDIAEPGLSLHRGHLVVETPAPAQPARSDNDVLSVLRPDLSPATLVASTPVEDVWEAILKCKLSGIGFAQEDYDGDMAKAYAEVIKQFDGIVPHEDGGRILTSADIERLKRPKRPRIKKEIWEAVIDDLRTLLRAFEIARDWLDEGGKLRNNIRDQMFADLGFVLRLNKEYGLCEEKAKADLSLNLAMTIAGALLTAAHPMVGFVFGLLWKVAAAERKDGGVVRAKIVEMERALQETREGTIQTVEKALIALVADWGNLENFVARVRSGEIVWPDDAAPIRRAHAVGYHTACLKTLMKLKSDTETYDAATSRHTWGVIQYQQDCGDVNRHYESRTGILRGKASDPDCLKYRWNDNWFFGKAVTHTGGQYGPNPPTIKLAPATLANKLFLAGTDADPGLGISDAFLDNPQERADWALHSVRIKGAGKI